MQSALYRKESRKRAALLLSVFGIVLFIYANSLQSGSESATESRGFFDALVKFFDFLPFFTHTFVRKMAHFAEYAALGAYVAAYMRTYQGSEKKHVFLALMLCTLVAVSDELLQAFVPMRHASVWDVVIDVLGSACGIAFVTLLAVAILRSAVPQRKECSGK